MPDVPGIEYLEDNKSNDPRGRSRQNLARDTTISYWMCEELQQMLEINLTL